ATGIGAVQQFYEVLGLVKPPRLTIDTERVQLTGKSGERLSGEVVLSTQDEMPVFAHADSNQAWLTPGSVKARRATATIPFEIVVPKTSGQTLQAQLTISANGNQCFIVQ